MTARTPLERDLTAWLSETAMPRTPEYADEILEQTIRTRQRPRWTFASRWLPIADISPVAPLAGRTVLRTVALLIVVGLILAAVAAVVGSRRDLPPPFGLAGTGLLAHNPDGDIALVDPETMESRTIVLEQDNEHEPRWSPDGTRLAFLRETARGGVVVVVDSRGRVQTESHAFRTVDTDSLAWSPDGRSIALGGDGPQGHEIYLIDAVNGTSRALPVDYHQQEVYWRPPDGRQLLFRAAGAHPGLAIVSIADGSVVRIPTPDADVTVLRPLGWTPDGRAVLYQQDSDALDDVRTIVRDVESGAETVLDVAFGHVSNDGARVAGIDASGRLCVLAISGGACAALRGGLEPWGGYGAALTWSPDDRWLAVSVSPGEPVWLVDPSGTVLPRIVAPSGPGSWQRVAQP